MTTKFLMIVLVVLVSSSLGLCLSAEYGAPGTKQLTSELRAQENRSQAPAGYVQLVDRAQLLKGVWGNAEDCFYFSGDKQAFEKFLQDYANITNIVAHTIITMHGTASVGTAINQSEGEPYDWALYCHPYGWREKHFPSSKTKFVLWVELRIGGKISEQEAVDSLKIPAGMQMLYVNQAVKPTVPISHSESPKSKSKQKQQ